MRKMKQLGILLLCLSLLIGLFGCSEEPAPSTSPDPTPSSTASPSTTPSQTTAPTETTAPVVDPAAVYHAAAAAMKEASAVEMQVTVSQEMALAGECFTSEHTQQITILDQGTEAVKMQLVEQIDYGSYDTDITEIYMDGTVYATVYGADFCSQMTAEDYAARLIPVVPMDAALFGTCVSEPTDGGTLLHFSDPLELESWLTTDLTELISASAEAVISEDGTLVKIVYNAEYWSAAAQVTATYTVEYADAADAQITAPNNPEQYIALQYLDAPRMVEQAYGYLCSYQNLSARNAVTTYVSAANYVYSSSHTMNTYYADGNLQAKLEYDFYSMDYANEEEYEYSLEEKFIDGKYTSSVDGGTPEANRGVDAEMVDEYIFGLVTGYIPDCSYFADAVCTDLGSLLLIEFTGSEELAKLTLGEICAELFQDENLLDDLSTAYETNEMSYYIAIDKYLGLPTAAGMYYEGTHTIDGYSLPTIRQVDQSFYLASMDAYEAIFEVSAPDIHPEEMATPLFYHVTGPDGQEMWLLGTIHIGDDRTGFLPQEIYDAFDASDALAVECNTRSLEDTLEEDEELSEAVSNAYYYSDGSTTADHISDEEIYQRAVKYMKATGNYFFNAPYMNAAMWSSAIDNYLMQQSYALTSDKGVDNRLLMMAEANGKEILEVESNLFQIEMLNGWSDELSQLLLEESMAQTLQEYAGSTMGLYEMWCEGDEAALTEYINADDTAEMTEEEKKLYEEYNNAIGPDRNDDMVQVAIDYLESGETVFYAVGLAHVLAEDGLVNGLREAGYTVELVQYE